MLTDGNGIPLVAGDILSGNHNDLCHVVPQFADMTKVLKSCGIVIENSILNADKRFDTKGLRRACRHRKITPNKGKFSQQKEKETGKKAIF